MKTERFAIRTIRRGKVKIGGVTYEPSSQFQVYDGRLDGMRYAFGRYWDADGPRPFVHLWGSEAFYHNPDEKWPGPECIEGRLPWEWWNAV